ncbi:hypothetical protein GCM10010412_051960 [Nonomuraea recticatena]|uniref:Uncharacterized protein n=1 Tax=Nonomuraea recticatena TaxID=46178 RepID=A0ABP6ESM6_9ACTN
MDGHAYSHARAGGIGTSAVVHRDGQVQLGQKRIEEERNGDERTRFGRENSGEGVTAYLILPGLPIQPRSARRHVDGSDETGLESSLLGVVATAVILDIGGEYDAVIVKGHDISNELVELYGEA